MCISLLRCKDCETHGLKLNFGIKNAFAGSSTETALTDCLTHGTAAIAVIRKIFLFSLSPHMQKKKYCNIQIFFGESFENKAILLLCMKLPLPIITKQDLVGRSMASQMKTREILQIPRLVSCFSCHGNSF